MVNLPSGAKGFIIRVVEQGTNYGQGTCLKGSFAVTDVSLTPTSLAEEPNYKWGGGGNRSNTITKEATCEVSYELKDLSIDWASAKANAEKTGMKAEFTNNYDEVRLKLPRTLDMSTCAYIRLNVPAQNVPIALKLYRKGKQVDVSYYNDISGSYLLVPEYDGMIDAIGIMSLSTPNPAGAFMLADLITFGLTQEPAPEEVSNNIVINGDFADEDMSDWSAALWGDGVTITQHTANKPIFGNTYTYATYSRRTSPYQCFAQDITGRVQQNETYTFSFWARLSNDYKGAPENQRVVQFAPYTVDKSGKENYNPRLDGVYSQVLEPGVWTYFEGTYKVTNDNPISKVVIRILEQGTNYGQGDCVKGSYSVAGVQMARYIPDPPSIDEDVPNLKDAMSEVFGDDFITGTAVTLDEMEDLGIEMLVNKHFNAVTIGNELKPDALFNYSNNEHTPLQTITFNGEKLEVPTLYFGRAEEILDTLKTWNESHPDDPVKVRGHVLVWHSQTPEWFFREGYTVKQNADGSENYVTPEVMNLRLEWYIKTVLEHFTGEDSPYKDMFYGWDVLNEAIYNGYRTDKVSSNEPLSQSTHSANSSWWAVYQSNEFIINAFRFANQYAPADVELYYNDYNECDNKKVVGIVKLLKDVQEAEGTRIDGMGMQGHYNMVSPTIKEIERAIRDYSEVVDKVMYTEFDMKVSGDISREELRQKEYISQAERYHDIYVLLKKLNAEDGINIGGFTVWGTVDKYSWLQNSSSVGGGADGDLTQCPLLFDSDYKVKPSYWALVDYTMVDPNWTDETTEAVKEETKPETPETSETVETPESQPETEPVVETNPVIEEQKKNNPALVVGIA
ncbi:MAG: endo-1,4-beta-xylanase, partial [Acetatifactor sp.]|nr:endo-1,4-beta-xylanase [Acetatifactor sp.]